MHPGEIWERSGRWEIMGEEMFRLTDRKGARLALAMTHEEIFAVLATELNSHKQLPQAWYQFQTKFRDEPRPRAGLIRTREFTMKDSYSFDLDRVGLDAAFDRHYGAYQRIFERLGIPAIPVEASSGTMGGSDSTEFMCPSSSGEDLVVYCPACKYAANIEKAKSRLAGRGRRPPGSTSRSGSTRPGVRTIEDLASGYDAAATRQIKTLVYVLDDKLTLVLMRGDHALNEQKLIDTTGATAVRPAQPDEIREALGALPGSLGAVGVGGLPILADRALDGRRDMVTGANVDDMHLRRRGRGPGHRRGPVGPTCARSTAGEACPRCGEPLELIEAIEVGHIFKLG